MVLGNQTQNGEEQGNQCKVLYEQNNQTDNCTDPKCSKVVEQHVDSTPTDSHTAVPALTRVLTQINVSVVFLCAYSYLSFGEANMFWLIYTIFTVANLIYCTLIFDISKLKNISVLLLIFGASTPILRTLTGTISTDTIYVMTAILMLVHIGSHRYGLDGVFVSPYLSLNASMCAAISLASRIDNTFQAFFLLTLAFQAFALFPKLNEEVDYSLVTFRVSTVAAIVCTCFISPVAIVSYAPIPFFFKLCQSFFVWCRRYKDKKTGPWDEYQLFEIDSVENK